jgi:Family of unknown function (DUF6221)
VSSDEELATWLRRQIRTSLEHYRQVAGSDDAGERGARCEAELAILDLYEQQAAKASENAMEEDRAWTLWPVIALLGSGYRHRAGYREEWKPG